MLDLQSIYFGQKHKDFDYQDLTMIKKVRRLAIEHQRQSVNDCNGEGFIKGQRYYCGQIDDYARREYGQGVKSAYQEGKEQSIFDIETDKLREKINKIVDQFNLKKYALWLVKPFRIEYQGDPRGSTVKLFYNDDYIEVI